MYHKLEEAVCRQIATSEDCDIHVDHQFSPFAAKGQFLHASSPTG